MYGESNERQLWYRRLGLFPRKIIYLRTALVRIPFSLVVKVLVGLVGLDKREFLSHRFESQSNWLVFHPCIYCDCSYLSGEKYIYVSQVKKARKKNQTTKKHKGRCNSWNKDKL